MEKKGLFIVIDWTDGSGKGTQTKLLISKLQENGYPVEILDFPRYGQPSAAMVSEYLNGKLWSAMEVGPYRASILYAIDRYAASFELKKWLEEGKIVVSNRYVSANMGHQAGKIKDPQEREKFLNRLEDLEYNIFWIPKPDINILLYMPPEIGQQLVDKKSEADRSYATGENKKRDIHEADIQHLIDAAQAYKEVAQKYNWTIIDSAPNGQIRTIEEIADQLRNETKKHL